MANTIQKFLYLNPATGELTEQTSVDTIQVADGINALDAVNKGQLDAAISAASSSAATEQARALAAEAVLDGKIAAEKARAEAAEALLDGKIATEKARAEAAEGVLDGKIAAEKSRAEAAEAVLTAAVSSEAAARAAAISLEVADRNTAIGVERSRALAAESGLQAQVTQEVTDRTAAVAVEAARATAEEDRLQTAIDTEISDRQSAISAEQTRAMGIEAGLQSGLDVLNGADTLAGSVAYAVKTARTALQSAIDAEVSARTSAVTALQTSLDSENARAIAAEGSLTSALNAEITNRNSAIAGVQSALDAEITARATAISGVQSDLSSAQSALRGSIDGVQSALNTEISNRQSAVSGVQSSLDGEIARALAAEGVLTSAMATEQAARIADDASVLASAKLYADGLSTGLKFKDSVRFALPLTVTVPNGGPTLNFPADFASAKPMLGVDDGDRILLIPAGNLIDTQGHVNTGIYVVDGNMLVRAADMKLGDDASGAYVYSEEGIIGSDFEVKSIGTAFVCSSTKGSDIVGTGALSWATFSRMENLDFGDGFQKNGQMVSLVAHATGAIAIGQQGIALKLADTSHLSTTASGLTLTGALVGGATGFADAEHSHSVIGFAAEFVSAPGVFVRAGGSNAGWNNPDVLGYCKDTFDGKSLIALSGVVDSTSASAFADGATLYLNNAGNGFVGFADVPVGKYAIPVAKKINGNKIFIALGTAVKKA